VSHKNIPDIVDCNLKRDFRISTFLNLKVSRPWPWPWPWLGSRGTPLGRTHWPVPTNQISFQAGNTQQTLWTNGFIRSRPSKHWI